jgi:hypothetical protein
LCGGDEFAGCCPDGAECVLAVVLGLKAGLRPARWRGCCRRWQGLFLRWCGSWRVVPLCGNGLPR